MSNSYYEKGANHYDHHKELHIDTVNGGDIGKLLSAFFKDDAEEAVIVGEEKEVKKPKKTTGQKPEKPRETMTFGRKSGVTEGHITLLYQKLVKEGWIEGNDADFKALFSGSRDELQRADRNPHQILQRGDLRLQRFHRRLNRITAR